MELMQQINIALESRTARIIEPGDRAAAAVALILEEKPTGLNILFIERSTNENDLWSGQIGFPGGRAEKRDKSQRDTAERETMEELGLNLSTGRYLGRLSDIAPGGLPIVVSCFVYAVEGSPVLHPDHHEVANAFWFPFREINNPARRSHMEFLFRNRLRRFPALRLFEGNKQPLWGLSYRLLRNFTCMLITLQGSKALSPIANLA